LGEGEGGREGYTHTHTHTHTHTEREREVIESPETRVTDTWSLQEQSEVSL